MEHKELTHKIIGCAMEVHKYLGNGFQEKIYQRALSIEMKMNGIEFNREFVMKLQYKGFHIGLLINFGAKSLQFKRVHNNNTDTES